MNQPINREVVAIAYNQLCTFEYGIAYEVFGLPRPEINQDWYEFKTVAAEQGPLRAAGGLTFHADNGINSIGEAGTIIIPGWRGADAVVPELLLSKLREAHARGVRIISICSGVFVLAAAGLLDGVRVTTHWRYQEKLRENYPEVCIETESLYVDAGNIMTSAGSSAGIDLCLYVVRKDFGLKVSNSVARRLVMHAHRQGGQRQFVEQPVAREYEADRLSGVLEDIRAGLDQQHSTSSLAAHAGMSNRTFHRRFVALTGLAPQQWINNERLFQACTLLETTASSLESIAAAVGFTDANSLRYHFRTKFSLTPGEYRRRFTPPIT